MPALGGSDVRDPATPFGAPKPYDPAGPAGSSPASAPLIPPPNAGAAHSVALEFIAPDRPTKLVPRHAPFDSLRHSGALQNG